MEADAAPPGRALVAVSLARCAESARRPPLGGDEALVDRIGRNVAQLAASQLAGDLRRRVFLLGNALPPAPEVAPNAVVAAPSDVVPLARSTSLPCALEAAVPLANAPPRSRSAPATPKMGAPAGKCEAPANPAKMLWRCVACGMATELDQLEPSADGTGFVHTLCGAVCMSAFVSGNGVEKRSRNDDMAFDSNARADFFQGSSVPWYGTLQQKTAAAIGGGLTVGGKRAGLSLVANLATAQSVREQHENILTSKQATRLRAAIAEVERRLDEHPDQVVAAELVQTARGLVEDLFLAAVRAKRVEEVAKANTGLLGFVVVKIAAEILRGDSQRRKAPTLEKPRAAGIGSIPEGSQASPMQVSRLTILAEELLGRPAERRGGSWTSHAASAASASSAASAAEEDEESFF